jgi:hypothetical protein
MAMIDVSRVINSPKLQQNYIVYRQSGHWLAGEFIETETELSLSGVVTVAKTKDLDQLPEGDRVKGVMCFYATKKLNVTRNNEGDKGTSDQIEWRGERYRVIQVSPHIDYGYYKAYAVRMAGD